MPFLETLPNEGLIPTTPFLKLGPSILPHVSVPKEKATSPAAKAEPDPELEPLACSFDDFYNFNKDNLITENDKDPFGDINNSRYFSAMEYLHLQQLRFKLMKQVQDLFKKVDCLLIPGDTDFIDGLFNLTGHPFISIPIGLNKEGMPYGVVIVGKMDDEGTITAVAKNLENKYNFWLTHRPEDYKK